MNRLSKRQSLKKWNHHPRQKNAKGSREEARNRPKDAPRRKSWNVESGLSTD